MKARNIKMTLVVTLPFLCSTLFFNNCSQQGQFKFQESSMASTGDSSSSGSTTTTDTATTSTETTTTDFNIQSQKVVVAAPPKVDILIIDDNSASMQDYQANMATRFSSFLSEVAGLDYQIGIVTTDVSSDKPNADGRMVNFDKTVATSTYILSSSMSSSSVQTLFSSGVQRPEIGSGWEQGIYATFRTLERSFDTSANSAPNRSFIRADAALAVIVVSNADESPEYYYTDRNDPDKLLAYVAKTFPKKSFQFHSIIVDYKDSSCLAKNNNEAYGVDYQYLSQMTGGIVGNICESDYGSQLAKMGSGVSKQVNKITLNCAPVDVNGDGTVDVAITDTNGKAVTGFTVSGTTVTLSSVLPVGTNTVTYACAK